MAYFMKRNESHKLEIIPAILPRTFGEIAEKVELIKSLVKTVQIDICDGHFVNSFTWPYKKHDDTFEKMLNEEEGLPDWQELDYEFDLMVDHPENVIEDWVSVGATRIILHAEAKGDVAGAVIKLKDRVQVGLALNIDTPIEVIDQVVSKAAETFNRDTKTPHKDIDHRIDNAGLINNDGIISCIQLMGIDHIGFQGQKFDEKVIEKIKTVRSKYPDILISIDGGVSLENAEKLISAGADRLIVGSAIFEAENPMEMVEKFKSL
jgi:ribulose-phosphate 3-epimerase